jgi:hypothetical protein
MHSYTAFMVASRVCGASRPIYRVVYTIGEHGEGYFYPKWMAVQFTDWPSVSLGASAIFYEYLYFVFYIFSIDAFSLDLSGYMHPSYPEIRCNA